MQTNATSSRSLSLAYAGLITTIGMLLGRFAGFSREVLIANYYGTTEAADSAIVLLTLPDLLIGLFIGGAANIVFVPLFQKVKVDQRFRSFVDIQLVTILAFGLLSVLLYFFALPSIAILAPGMTASTQANLLTLFRWTLMAIPITAATALTRAYLHADQRFVSTAFANFIYNLTVIAALVFFTHTWGLTSVVVAIILGTTIRYGSQLTNILLTSKLAWNQWAGVAWSTTVKKYGQALGAGTLLILFPYIARSFSSLFFGEGYIAVFNYSFKLVELPFGVAISVFAIVIFPKLALLASQSSTEHKEAEKIVNQSLEYLFMLAIPLAVALCWFFYKVYSEPPLIMHISRDNLQDICILAMFGFLVLPIRGLSSVHIALLSSKEDTYGPLRINLMALPLLVIGSYLFGDFWGIKGIGLALAITYIFICSMEAWYIKKTTGTNTFTFVNDRIFLRPLIVSLFVFAGLEILLRLTNNLPFYLDFVIAFAGGLGCLAIHLYTTKGLMGRIRRALKKR